MSAVAAPSMFDFVLPPELEAGEPPEARGLRRDQVRLMVSRRGTGEIWHARFDELPAFLSPGDVLVLNTSRTRNSAIKALRRDGMELELHLSTHLHDDVWSVEVRALDRVGKSHHFGGGHPGEELTLIAGASATLLGRHAGGCDEDGDPSGTLWDAQLHVPQPIDDYLARHAFPIRYNYVSAPWPLFYYQTVYATETGSAEMPSAGRPFSEEVLDRIRERGVTVAPLILHTGVSNLETHEPPYREFYRVPEGTALAVNLARAEGRGVIAVGTTVVRALESVTNAEGRVHPGEGWTCLVVSPETQLRAVNALLTGFHEPQASHLAILEALAGESRIAAAYAEALRQHYLWHEFGDLHLILP